MSSKTAAISQQNSRTEAVVIPWPEFLDAIQEANGRTAIYCVRGAVEGTCCKIADKFFQETNRYCAACSSNHICSSVKI